MHPLQRYSEVESIDELTWSAKYYLSQCGAAASQAKAARLRIGVSTSIHKLYLTLHCSLPMGCSCKSMFTLPSTSMDTGLASPVTRGYLHHHFLQSTGLRGPCHVLGPSEMTALHVATVDAASTPEPDMP